MNEPDTAVCPARYEIIAAFMTGRNMFVGKVNTKRQVETTYGVSANCTCSIDPEKNQLIGKYNIVDAEAYNGGCSCSGLCFSPKFLDI
jgi:hypothetical protein